MYAVGFNSVDGGGIRFFHRRLRVLPVHALLELRNRPELVVVDVPGWDSVEDDRDDLGLEEEVEVLAPSELDRLAEVMHAHRLHEQVRRPVVDPLPSIVIIIGISLVDVGPDLTRGPGKLGCVAQVASVGFQCDDNGATSAATVVLGTGWGLWCAQQRSKCPV